MMTPTMVALILVCLFLGGLAHAANSARSASLRVESARVGGSVTLQCFSGNHVHWFFWYKQTAGQKLHLVSSYYQYSSGRFHNEFNVSRFKLETEQQKHNLIISDLQLSDSATYYCVSNDLRTYEFEEGIFVNIEGSGVNVQALVRQPATSLNVSCMVDSNSCDGGHSVSWFRNSEESHPGIIYAHGSRIKTQTCIYNLPEKSGAHPDYCAVALCGHMLFGNVNNFKNKSDPPVLGYFLSGALAFNVILIVSMVLLMKKGNIFQCSDSKARLLAAPPPHPEDCQPADDLHYAALIETKVGASKSRRGECRTECVYSTVRQ